MMNAMPKRDARSLSHEASAELRRSAVRLVLSGSSQKDVAAKLQVHPVTICKWMAAYEERGEDLFIAKQPPGAEPKLDERQVRVLRRIIVGKNPDQLNFGVALWTLPIIAQLVEARFGIIVHATTISRLLHRIGITPQKPVRRAFQRDDYEVRKWVEERFPGVVREVRRKQAVLLFEDETGLHEDHAVGTTWGARGQTPIVRTTGTRRRINVISALSPRGRLWFRCYHGTLTATRYVEFLRALLRDIRGPIVLVHDRHPAHIAAAVRRFIQENRHRLSVHELPPYAPDLNPDEHVWAAVKGMFRRDPVHKDEDFASGVEAAMESIVDDPQLVKSFFGHPAVAYIKQALGW
jgi:transposase